MMSHTKSKILLYLKYTQITFFRWSTNATGSDVSSRAGIRGPWFIQVCSVKVVTKNSPRLCIETLLSFIDPATFQNIQLSIVQKFVFAKLSFPLSFSFVQFYSNNLNGINTLTSLYKCSIFNLGPKTNKP